MSRTRTRRSIVAAAATGLALAGALLAAPGASAVGGTITLTATGGLSVTEPTSTVNLGSTASTVGAWTSGSFGTVTVSDSRTGLLANTWTASVAISDFTRATSAGGTSTQETIPAAGIVYHPGTPSAGSNNTAVSAVFTPVVAAAGTTAARAVGAMTALGVNSESWNPTLTVTLANQIAGAYNGTIVHSAA